MTPDTLERLMIDRSLGALSPDVEALLAAHLNGNPADAETAAAFDRTVDLVERSLHDTAIADGASPEPIPFQQIERRERVLHRRGRLINASGMSAALALGCILGASFFAGGRSAQGRLAGTEAPSTVPAPPLQGTETRSIVPAAPLQEARFVSMPQWQTFAQLPRHSRDEVAAAVHRIWSADRLLSNMRSASQDKNRVRLIWDSPLRKPRLGEQT